MSETKDGKPRRRKSSGLRDLAIVAFCLLLAGGGIVALRTYARPFRVPSQSMAPTIVSGEYVLTTAIARANGAPVVRDGDVVVFLYSAENGGARDYIKRIIALPGERVAFRDGVPIVNGVAATQTPLGPDRLGDDDNVRRRETLGGRTYETDYAADGDGELRFMAEITVPPGQMFVVGDNRDNSYDSRVMGPVPLSTLRFRALRILYSAHQGRTGQPIQ